MGGISFALHGLAVSSGIAIGRAHLVSHALLEVSHYEIPENRVEDECSRLRTAADAIKAELAALKATTAASQASAELNAFLDLQAMMLEDPLLIEAACERIRQQHLNAEWALTQQLDTLLEQFDAIEDPYLRERRADVIQLVERLLKELLGLARPPKPRRDDLPTVVVAHDLSPADTIGFRGQHIAGFLTDVGGPTSHTAIVARSLQLPAVVGVRLARQLLQEDDLVIIDGARGVAIVNPHPSIVEEYRLRKAELEISRTRLALLKDAPTVTLDGTPIELLCNIETPRDLELVQRVNADGIGLYRTEFLFLDRLDRPSEDEQYEAYRDVLKSMKGKPVTIRTFDLGGDKDFEPNAPRVQPNLALGLRAIRYCLADPTFFLTQLRALLRASVHGKLKIMLPMVAHAHEIDQTLQLLARAKEQLQREGKKFAEDVELGAMVEIPAAALAPGIFLKRVQFLSIGTNDLIQYTLAIDRQDDAVADLYDPLHPAVLRLIAGTIQFGIKNGLPVSLCGELAGHAEYTWLFLGMGLRQFSMHPERVLSVKQRLLRADLTELTPKVQRLLKLDEPARLREAFEKLNTAPSAA